MANQSNHLMPLTGLQALDAAGSFQNGFILAPTSSLVSRLRSTGCEGLPDTCLQRGCWRTWQQQTRLRTHPSQKTFVHVVRKRSRAGVTPQVSAACQAPAAVCWHAWVYVQRPTRLIRSSILIMLRGTCFFSALVCGRTVQCSVAARIYDMNSRCPISAFHEHATPAITHKSTAPRSTIQGFCSQFVSCTD
jgi:hypothetical protein